MKTNFKICRQWPWIYLRFSVSKNLYFAKFSSNVWPVHSWKREDVENREKNVAKGWGEINWLPKWLISWRKGPNIRQFTLIEIESISQSYFHLYSFFHFFRLNVDQLEKKCNNKNVPFFNLVSQQLTAGNTHNTILAPVSVLRIRMFQKYSKLSKWRA